MSTRELTVLPVAQPVGSAEWQEAARKARLLSWISLAWMGAEGVIALAAGIAAGSIALISFGLDSFIEGFASLVIVWRFTGLRLYSPTAETRAQKLVAIQFFLLAPYVAFEAVHKLWAAEEPSTSWLGIALVTSSLVGMPALGIAKRRLANRLGSVATRGEGTQESPLRLSSCGRSRWSPRERTPRALVARPARGPRRRRCRGQGRGAELARRGLLLSLLDEP
jgi:hypothetical protein